MQGCILNVEWDIDVFLLIVVSWHIKNHDQKVNFSPNNLNKTVNQKIALFVMKLRIFVDKSKIKKATLINLLEKEDWINDRWRVEIVFIGGFALN